MENQISKTENESATNEKPEKPKGPIRSLLGNLFQPNRFLLAYRTEQELYAERQRVAKLQLRNLQLVKDAKTAFARHSAFELVLAVLVRKYGSQNRIVIPRKSMDAVKEEFNIVIKKHGDAIIVKVKGGKE